MPRKPKRNALDRKLAALVKLHRTKGGPEIMRQHREAFLYLLCLAVGKP